LINGERKEKGIFEPIKYEIRLDRDKNELNIPYVLIEQQDAWLVLQQIGALCGAYVYMDRRGYVIVESDQSMTTLERVEREISSDASYRVVEMEYVVGDEESIRDNGLSEYEYDASLFAVVQRDYETPNEVVTLGEGLLEQYRNGVGYVETAWWGDPSMQLGSIFLAQSQYEDRAKVYECMRNEIRRDSGGYRMKTTGREVLGANVDDYLDNILISPSNAFSFSIPVLSRTIVNRVIVKDRMLVEDQEPETITVKREKCKPVLDENQNPTGVYTCTVGLAKIYDKIKSVKMLVNEYEIDIFDKIISYTVNSVVLKTSKVDKEFNEIEIKINV
jgi:hypothetical protein